MTFMGLSVNHVHIWQCTETVCISNWMNRPLIISPKGTWPPQCHLVGREAGVQRDSGFNQFLLKKYYFAHFANSGAHVNPMLWLSKDLRKSPCKLGPWSLNFIHLNSPLLAFSLYSLKERNSPNWESLFCERKDTDLEPGGCELCPSSPSSVPLGHHLGVYVGIC